ncbi:GNAT family N-acetyltransferase [Sphingomonas sp.]|jgi:CelD/BcsL family acetyltransferase involved in cellulose biosynthesis|uniref:GNAT family N-acetyltransferase n=1 Tax=Sphingomonas sp. TaxID=28214 RepID=UPI002E30CC7A|nr:GNAT family N-acetyltransferase [Sphingomonas sp.]HEX4696019.1 GNAT family N-acetyltransferase [Sphingomonas sp.]
MTKPMLLSDFVRLPPTMRATAFDGLSGLIDKVAQAAPTSHAFLRYQWFAAATAAYGLRARTLVVERDGDPVIAMPIAQVGPRRARLAMVPGSYWPFRGFPARADAEDAGFDVLLDRLAAEVNGLRVGPSYDGDPVTSVLIAAARRRGWAVLDRFVADSFALDMAAASTDGAWPRSSTLKKNRFLEKHLAEHGELDWRFLTGADLAAGGFDQLAAVEEKSWIAARTDGRDAKFTRTGHGAFWRQAMADPVLAEMACAALLTVGGEPAAFSFDLNLGTLKYAIANGYDPAFAKQSPGKLLYYRNLVRALEDGMTDVDWGAGDSGYKRVIGAEQGPAIRDWLLLRPGVPAVLGRMLSGMWRRSGRQTTAAEA